MASPSWTFNTLGNIASGVVLNSFADSSVLLLNFSTVQTGHVQIGVTAQKVSKEVSGCLVCVYRNFSTNDNVPLIQFTIPVSQRDCMSQSFELNSGKYTLMLTNQDDENDISVCITTNTLSWPQ